MSKHRGAPMERFGAPLGRRKRKADHAGRPFAVVRWQPRAILCYDDQPRRIRRFCRAVFPGCTMPGTPTDPCGAVLVRGVEVAAVVPSVLAATLARPERSEPAAPVIARPRPLSVVPSPPPEPVMPPKPAALATPLAPTDAPLTLHLQLGAAQRALVERVRARHANDLRAPTPTDVARRALAIGLETLAGAA